MKHIYDVAVIGGGPAGLAAAIQADKERADVLLIEREGRLGGILKQCIHDGFGLVRYGEKLSGPEYVERFVEEFKKRGISYKVWTFVTSIEKSSSGFHLTMVNKSGVLEYETKTIVLATGCRERTARQVSIHGTRPSGIFTAGAAQHLVNLSGLMPTKRCVILGSGDIGLIMARRLTLEGAHVLGVYEVKPNPSGLTRNLVQCLDDYNIPLHLSHTVTRVFGQERLNAVEIMQVDETMKPIPHTEQILECDALILSVGLIPENEIAQSLGIHLHPGTKGPACDSDFMTEESGVFICGNALHVNDLVDYVTESGELAGKGAAHYDADKKPESYVPMQAEESLQYVVPQRIKAGERDEVIFYFRSRKIMKDAVFVIEADGKEVFKRSYRNLRPPEMERIAVDLQKADIGKNSIVKAYIRSKEA